MDSEQIMVCDESGKRLGQTSREEIHKKGLWHETFHCWVVTREADRSFIHLQLRSPRKKDLPDLLDITAAGHILADEKMEEGIREVEEELGIQLSFEELIPLGVIHDQIIQEGFIDNERCHVFLYRTEQNLDDRYELQKEEVAGMVKAEFESFYALCTGERDEMEVEGFRLSDDQKKIGIRKVIGRKDMVPHSREYLEKAAGAIRRALKSGFGD